MPTAFDIEVWVPPADADTLAREIDELGELLRLAVYGGAGVSFFVPFPIEQARAFWIDTVLPAVGAGTRHVLVARERGRIIGTVQLDLALPPNQAHRAEVAKMLVHPDARRRGVARGLMTALEDVARRHGRTLLTLDTVTGSAAELLYTSLGYVTVGIVPRFARKSLSTDLEAATIMFKELTGVSEVRD
jgi:GNAT superfamily N-acetyltransferase